MVTYCVPGVMVTYCALHMYYLNSHNSNSKIGTITILILQMKKPRHRGIKYLA